MQRLCVGGSHASLPIAILAHPLLDPPPCRPVAMGAHQLGESYRLVSVHALLHRPALSTGLL